MAGAKSFALVVQACSLLLICSLTPGSGRLAQPTSVASSSRILQNADYTLLNSILGGLQLELDTSDVEDVRFENTFTTLDATFGDTTEITGLGIEQIEIGTNTNVAGSYGIDLGIDTLLFQAVIGLEMECVTNCNGFAGTPGTLTITSNTASDSTLDFSLVIEGDDFNAGPPTGASFTKTCAESIDFSGLNFDAEDLGTTTIRIIFFDVVVDLDDTVDDTLADDPSLGVDAIVSSLCKEIEPLLFNLTTFIVENPLTTGELFEPQSIEAALEKEQDLKDNLPAGATLLDINSLLDSSSIVLDDDSSIVATVLELLQVTDSGSGWIVSVLEQLIGIDITGNGGALDFVEAAAALLNTTKAGILEYLQFEFSIPGSVEVSLSTSDAAASLSSLPSSLLLEVPGTNTLSLSGSAGDIDISGDFSLDLFLDIVLLNQSIQVDISETFSVSLNIQSVSATIAALLPLNGDVDLTLEQLLAALFDDVDCTPGLFAVAPSISAAILAQEGLTVGASGIEEAILFVVAELVSSVLPVYAYVAGQVLGAILSDTLNPVITDLICL